MNLTLTGDSIFSKREEIKKYFLDTYKQFEMIFTLLKNDTVFYRKSELTRHPMIFYYGHTATFFINKLIKMKIINKRINKNFEAMFEVGVDEMSWDDMNEKNYSWPKVEDVREYRNEVKSLVINLIDNINFSLPITWDSDMWIILMAIEHEKIHTETSLVLHRQMKIEFINENIDFKICNNFENSPINSFIKIPSNKVVLGKAKDSEYYGWDNEYGSYIKFVDEFQTTKYLVSNKEFLEFIKDKGYENKDFWCDEGKNFLKNSNAKHPFFWIKQKNNSFKYRTINKIIPLPLSWPVEVNALEANAFLKYKSFKDSLNYKLPTEAQYKAIYNFSKIEETNKANHNLNLYSSCPVNSYSSNGIYDVIGNVWQWSQTPIFPYDEFKIHEAYDDFTTPTFDNKHLIINGSSWASSGNLIDPNSRYAFRNHFYQNVGFRYILEKNRNNKEEKLNNNIYETDKLVSQYCEFQYGDEYFGIKNFSKACMKIVKKFINKNDKVLDIGCATGRLSFELAKYFKKVEAVDFSVRFIEVGIKLQKDKIEYRSYGEGELYTKKSISLEQLELEDIKNKVTFYQGDACNLKPKFNSYDMIIGTNLIDRLYEPKIFLDDVKNRLNENGILILTSPYTWLENYTKKSNWIGGYKDENSNEITTLNGLKNILEDNFKLIDNINIPFVIKETSRKYQHTISELTVWQKK